MSKLMLLGLGAAAGSYVRVPGGRLVHEDCMHTVPSGTHVEELNNTFVFTHPDGTTRSVPTCENPDAPVGHLGVGHGNAWKTWAQFKAPNSRSVTRLSNTWTVPPAPTVQSNQILYYWNGVEDGGNAGGTGVLQPVLEWRAGSHWGIKSWYVGAGGTVTSDLVATPSGSVIHGSMEHNGDGTWTVSGFAEGGQPATLSYTRQSLTFTYAYEVLEAYTVGSTCSMYPPDGGLVFTSTKVAFDGQDVADDDVNWEAFSCPSGPGCVGSASCGESTKITGSDVAISYNTGSMVV